MTKKPVTKAVIAAAGFGTRFLPQTKAIPKEMLPIIDKPIIQYIVEELVAVGVKDIIIVTGYSKRAVEDHFDKPSEDLMNNLREGGESKKHLVEEVEKIGNLANFIYVRQKGRYGNATPLMNVEHLIDDEAFFYTYSDDFFTAKPLRFQQMLNAYNTYNCPILSTIRVKDERDYDRYGFADGKPLDRQCTQLSTIVEKPGLAHAPSDLATVSGFLLTSDVFKYFHQWQEQLTEDHEFYANDALKLMLKDDQRMVACEITNGQYYDIGDKVSYLKTLFDIALKDPEISGELKAYLAAKLKEYNGV